MSFAGARILAGIAVVGAVAFGGPQAAEADVVGQGSLALGGLVTFTPAVDSTQFAQFEVNSSATDLTMMVSDDQNTIVCQTTVTTLGSQSCGWVPVSGANYTVYVMRPASADAIAAAQAATVSPDAGSDGANVAANQNGLGGATEDFVLSTPAAN